MEAERTVFNASMNVDWLAIFTRQQMFIWILTHLFDSFFFFKVTSEPSNCMSELLSLLQKMCHIDLLEQNALTRHTVIQPACFSCLEFSFSHSLSLCSNKYIVYLNALNLYCTYRNLYPVLCYLCYAVLGRRIYSPPLTTVSWLACC